MNSRPRNPAAPAGLPCILAALLLVSGCQPGPLNSPARPESLSRSGVALPEPALEIDSPAAQEAEADTYLKNLIIVERDIVQTSIYADLEKDGSWHFRKVMTELAGSMNVDDFMKSWINLWRKNIDDTRQSDRALARTGSANVFLDAWDNDRIDLIGIVNRIDLTKFGPNDTVTELGQGRLVYELRDEANQVLKFSIIVEFGLKTPPVCIDPTATTDPTAATDPNSLNDDLYKWARCWTLLGSLDIESPLYLTNLKNITDAFVSLDNLKQIRTNEKTNGGAEWELREFAFNYHGEPAESGNGLLVQRALGETPRDIFKGNTDNTLMTYIGNKNNTDSIIAGNHAFTAAADGLKLLGIKALFKTTGDTWGGLYQGVPSPTAQRAGYIVSFNTCDGCHMHATGDEQHIHREISTANAVLSSFLSGPTPTDFALPRCAVIRPWCRPKSWNEKIMRLNFLSNYSKFPPDSSKEESDLFSQPINFYRVH